MVSNLNISKDQRKKASAILQLLHKGYLYVLSQPRDRIHIRYVNGPCLQFSVGKAQIEFRKLIFKEYETVIHTTDRFEVAFCRAI